MNAARRGDPDRILIAKLSGTAQRLARAGGSMGDAVTELRKMANGRADLLAETAGVMCGYWSASPDTETGDYVVAIGLLISAGADHNHLARWFDVGRERARVPRHSV